MNIGDVVEVHTGCHDCGVVDAKIIDFVGGMAKIEVIGKLPPSIKTLNLTLDLKYLRTKDD